MGRRAQERADWPKEPWGSHPPPQHRFYSGAAMIERYKEPIVRALVKKLEPLYTIAETAKILALSEKTVRRRIDDGLLRAIKLRRGDDHRGAVRIAQADLEDFIRDHRSH